MNVPLLDLRAQYAPLKSQFLSAIEEVCDSQALVLGPKTEALERSVEAYCGAQHAIGCSSGTDAQLMLLMALGIGPGDAVLTTPYTFFATASCVSRVGARPVFADIDPATYNLCPLAAEEVLKKTPGVKAIVPVHLYGCCADMAAFVALGKKYGIPVLEDAAQALGAQHPLGAAGAIGEAGWFSFYPTKNLGAFGDAGMVVCRDEALAAKLRAFRNHGMETRYYHEWIGGNFRIDALQSAVLSVKLPHLDTWSAGRRAHANAYRAAFADIPLTLPIEPWAASGVANHHIYNQFILRTARRDALRAHLTAAGIGSEIYYPLSLHQQTCFRDLGYREGDFPASEQAARETLALPIFPELNETQRGYVVEKVREFFGESFQEPEPQNGQQVESPVSSSPAALPPRTGVAAPYYVEASIYVNHCHAWLTENNNANFNDLVPRNALHWNTGAWNRSAAFGGQMGAVINVIKGAFFLDHSGRVPYNLDEHGYPYIVRGIATALKNLGRFGYFRITYTQHPQQLTISVWPWAGVGA